MQIKRIFITGTSGTGKSTIVRNLNSRGIPAIDTDSIGRWRDKETGDLADWYPSPEDEWPKKIKWHQDHHWILDAVRFRELLTEGGIKVAAGLAANQNEFADLFTTTLLLQCEEQIFIERIMQREDSSYGKDAAEQQQILRLYKGIEANMLDRGAVPINANRPLDQVVDEVLSFVVDG